MAQGERRSGEICTDSTRTSGNDECGYGNKKQMKISEGQSILPCLVMHGAMVLDISNIAEDGRTACERRRGKKCQRDSLAFGENICQ